MDGRTKLEQRFLLCLWLDDVRLLHQAARLKDLGLDRLEDVHHLKDHHVELVLGSEMDQWSLARRSLPANRKGLELLKKQLLDRVAGENTPSQWHWIEGLIAVSLGLGGLAWSCGITQRLLSLLPRNLSPIEMIQWLVNSEMKPIFVQWLSGQSALARNAQVTFQWMEPCTVGRTVSLAVKFYQRNGRPYPISNADQFRVDIRQGENAVATAVQVGASNDADSEAHQVKVSFTVRKAGQYHIGLHVSHTPIRGSPFVKNFLPGPPDGGATFIVRPSSMAVCTVGTPHQLLLEPKDEFGNACAWAHDGLQQQQKALADFTIDCHPMGSTEVVQPCVQWFWVEVMHRLLVHVTFTKEGVYVLRVQFRKETLNKGEFSMIVLSRGETSQVEKTLLTRSSSYEARLVSLNGERASKAKKVYCSLSPKQLAIKEYILGFIPKRVATFRVCPATKFSFHGGLDQDLLTSLTIEDPSQTEVEIVSREAHLLAANFTHYLMRNIGGSETFADKQDFFYVEVRKHHQRKVFDKVTLRIERERVLPMSLKATKGFSVGDWCKKFEIVFTGEQGLKQNCFHWFECYFFTAPSETFAMMNVVAYVNIHN